MTLRLPRVGQRGKKSEGEKKKKREKMPLPDYPGWLVPQSTDLTISPLKPEGASKAFVTSTHYYVAMQGCRVITLLGVQYRLIIHSNQIAIINNE